MIGLILKVDLTLMIKFTHSFIISLVAIFLWIIFLGFIDVTVFYNKEPVWKLYSFRTIFEKGKVIWQKFNYQRNSK